MTVDSLSITNVFKIEFYLFLFIVIFYLRLLYIYILVLIIKQGSILAKNLAHFLFQKMSLFMEFVGKHLNLWQARELNLSEVEKKNVSLDRKFEIPVCKSKVIR